MFRAGLPQETVRAMWAKKHLGILIVASLFLTFVIAYLNQLPLVVK